MIANSLFGQAYQTVTQIPSVGAPPQPALTAPEPAVSPFVSAYQNLTGVSAKPSRVLGAINAKSSVEGLPEPQARALIQKYFPQDQWDNAYKVMQGESGGHADAVGDDYPINGEVRPSYGLFQIRTFPDRPAPDQLKDAETNVSYAAKLYEQQGWAPWTAARNLGLVGGRR